MVSSSNRTDWSDTLGLELTVLQSSLENLKESIKKAHDLCNEGTLLQQWGSRSLPWRIFLGLLSSGTESESDEEIRLRWI